MVRPEKIQDSWSAQPLGAVARRCRLPATILATVALLFLPSRPALGNIKFSQHNFSGTSIIIQDSCSACHRPHGAVGDKLWQRSLDEEINYFDQQSNPDYIPWSTLFCYDCHDDNPASLGSGTVDNSPDYQIWSETPLLEYAPLLPPQDIAFTDGPMPSTEVGYYELANGEKPGSPGNPAPTDGSSTGGHYWRSASVNAPFAQGDKIPCTFCHDPHADDPDMIGADATANEAMFRRYVPRDTSGGTLGPITDLTASSATRNGDGTGRDMCALCHLYADDPATPPLFFGVIPPKPTDMGVHRSSDTTTACTACHKHNYVTVRCDTCHGYPPMSAADLAARLPGEFVNATLEDYTGGGAGHNAPDHLSPVITTDDGFSPCLKCHPDNQHIADPTFTDTTIDAQDRLDGDITISLPITYYAKNGTMASVVYNFGASTAEGYCADVSCHGGQNSPFWTDSLDPDTQCAVCHIREDVSGRAAAAEYQSAITGMHAITTSVSGQDHWTDPNSTCGGADACHAGQPQEHFGANLDTPGLVELDNANANMKAGIDIAVSGGAGLHDPTDDTCAVDCHRDAIPGPPYWSRLNNKTLATATDGTECSTCHGTFALGWTVNAGILNRPSIPSGGPPPLVAAHEADWDADGNPGEVVPRHQDCKWCHGMNSQADKRDSYLMDVLWDPTGVQSDHGNGLLNMNGPSIDDIPPNTVEDGSEYNANQDGIIEYTDYACTAACHSGPSNANKNMGDSFWPIQWGDYDEGICERCHNILGPPSPTLVQPPNVMGDGVDLRDPGGPFADGTYGFNVNGHGTKFYAVQSRNIICPDCHALLNHHLNDEITTLDWPGQDNLQEVNTSHLIDGFIATSGTAEQYQITFDDFCTNECHPGSLEMRHSDYTGSTPDKIMLFGEHMTNSDPKGTRVGETLWGDDQYSNPYPEDEKFNPDRVGGDPASSYWFPWTIADITSNVSMGTPYYGICVSCHDPHGTPTSDTRGGSNKMLRYNWFRPPATDAGFFCNSQCHRP